MSKRVIIYQDGLLSYSETFIKQQALALKTWKPILIGHKYLRRSLDFSMLQSQLLVSDETFFIRRWLYALKRRLNKVDPIGLGTLKKIDAKLIHAHFGTSAVDIWPYAKALKLPMLVTLHGFDICIRKEWWQSGRRGSRKRHYPAQLLALAAEPQVHFLAVSTAIKQKAIEFGIPDAKLTTSYIGVDADAFQPSAVPLTERSNRIIYVGRLVEKKGAGYLLDAFHAIKQQVPDAELVIVGKGPLEDKLKAKVAELGLSDVVFTGALTSQQVKQEIDKAKIFCLPSITAVSGDAEGLPISILEAQASGVFVVSSSRGGVGDNLIDQQTCFTFAEKDSEHLARILAMLLTQTEQHLPIIEKQRALIATTFRLDICGEQLEKMYDKFGAVQTTH